MPDWGGVGWFSPVQAPVTASERISELPALILQRIGALWAFLTGLILLRSTPGAFDHYTPDGPGTKRGHGKDSRALDLAARLRL